MRVAGAATGPENWPFGAIARGHFGAIAVDPPWHFSGGAKGRPQHYRRMWDPEIAAMPVRELAASSCSLFLWTTTAKLPDALAIMKAWRFRYSGVAFVWAKLHRRFGNGGDHLFIPRDAFHVGTGFTTRKNTEICLLGKVGKPTRRDLAVPELIISPLREHSRKPDEVSVRIRRLYDGPYIELFAREQRAGWTSWGNEVEKFSAAPFAPMRGAA